jgi:hypothetical protein
MAGAAVSDGTGIYRGSRGAIGVGATPISERQGIDSLGSQLPMRMVRLGDPAAGTGGTPRPNAAESEELVAECSDGRL